MAKGILLIFIAIVLCISCSKTDVDDTFANLVITKAEAPDTTTLEQGITINVQGYGPDLCYKFSHFDVRNDAPFQYNISARATITKGEVACLQAINKFDKSLTVKPNIKGQYVLRFHHVASGTAFITDTVQVN